MTVSYFEWVQDRMGYFWDERMVNERLEGIMTRAFHDVLSVATTQAVRLAEAGEATARNGDVVTVQADTLCIHGDTPGAAEKARAVRDVLESHGVEIRAHTMR